MTKTEQKASGALLAMALTTLSASAVTPALASIGTAFPEIPPIMISMLSTLPALISSPVAIITGHLAGKKVSFRRLSIIGILILFISGMAPYFSDSFYTILFWRSLFGCGVGILTPNLISITLLLFDKKTAQVQSGNNIIFTNSGAIIFQLIGGFLCTRLGWKNTFLVYLLIIPCFIIVTSLLPEPGISGEGEQNEENKISLKPVVKWCLFNFVYVIFLYPLITDTSSLILANGFGTAATAGIVLSFFTAGGVLGGILFRKLCVLKNQAVFLVAGLFFVTGYGLIAYCTTLSVLTIGETLAGIGFGLMNPFISTTAGFSVNSEGKALASSLVVSFGKLGGFLSAFFLAFVMKLAGVENERLPFKFSMYFFIFSIILYFLIICLCKPKEK